MVHMLEGHICFSCFQVIAEDLWLGPLKYFSGTGQAWKESPVGL